MFELLAGIFWELKRTPLKFAKFEKRCFKCNAVLSAEKESCGFLVVAHVV